MLVVIAGPANNALDVQIAAMAKALRGATGKIGIWRDARKGVAVAGRARGIQPEDVFDRQPYVDDALCFVADGRVDDREEVARQLDLSPQQLAGMADSELLYRVYRRHGEDLPRIVYGHFAFAALHRDSGRVVLSDDHIGSLGVYYAERNGTLIAASQMGALLAHPAVAREPDVAALALLVAPRMSKEQTAIRSVFLLGGGNLLCRDAGRAATVRRWWQPEAHAQIRYGDDRQYVEHAASLLEQSVRANMRCVGGVAASLSGGLDSSLVVAIAAGLLRDGGTRLTAYTSAPEYGVRREERPGWDADESGLTADLARLRPNIDNVVVRPDGECFLDVLPDLHALSHTTVRNTGNTVWLLQMLRQTCALGHRALLTGQRGNAIISVEDRYVFDSLFGGRRWLTALRLAMGEARLGGTPAWRLLASQIGGPVRKLRVLHPNRTERPGAHLLRPAFRHAHRVLLARQPAASLSRQSHVDFATFSQRFCTPDSMAQTGVEVREPLAGRRLIETVLAFPVEAHLAGGRSRGLAREIGFGIVPDSIRLRRRRGSQVPELAGLLALHADRYRKALNDLRRSPACADIFDLDAASDVLERIAGGNGDNTSAYSVERLIGAGGLIAQMGF